MTNDLKQSVTATIEKMKKENKKDALANTAWGVAGLAVAAIAGLLFPPGGAAYMFTVGGVIFGISNGYGLIRNAGHHKTLRAAELEAASDASVPLTMARGATHRKTARAATGWSFKLLVLALGAAAMPALLPASIFAPLYTTILLGLSTSIGIDAFNDGAAKTSREIEKQANAAPTPAAAAPAATQSTTLSKKLSNSLSSAFKKVFSKVSEQRKPKAAAQPQVDSPVRPNMKG